MHASQIWSRSVSCTMRVASVKRISQPTGVAWQIKGFGTKHSKLSPWEVLTSKHVPPKRNTENQSFYLLPVKILSFPSVFLSHTLLGGTSAHLETCVTFHKFDVRKNRTAAARSDICLLRWKISQTLRNQFDCALAGTCSDLSTGNWSLDTTTNVVFEWQPKSQKCSWTLDRPIKVSLLSERDSLRTASIGIGKRQATPFLLVWKEAGCIHSLFLR